MKNLRNLLFMALSLLLIVSCGDDDGEQVVVLDNPTVTSSTTIGDVVWNSTTDITFQVTIPAGYASNRVDVVNGSAAATSTLEAAATSGDAVVAFTADGGLGAASVTFWAIDADGNASSATVVMNVIAPESSVAGAVYAMTNGLSENTVVAYSREVDGTLTFIDEYGTGGQGSDQFDGPEGLDPLISAYALTLSDDNRFVLAANAGSNTITVFEINPDYTLTRVDEQGTGGIGPNSIVVSNGSVYVSNIAQLNGEFSGEPDQEGSLYAFNIDEDGQLSPIFSTDLENRPSAVAVSPAGDFLVVTSINSGSSVLASDSEDEVVVFGINSDGTLTEPLGAATSTLRGNDENRNLPSAIGVQVVADNFVVVTEAREFQADGTPPAFPALQSGSVSVWQIQSDGSLSEVMLDVASGNRATESGRTACWLDFNAAGDVFYVSNAIEAGLASYSFDQSTGEIALINETAALGTGTGGATDPGVAFGNTEGWIDLWVSADGNFLYQLYGLDGTIGVYQINDDNTLTLVEEVSGDLPTVDTQGIVAL